LSRWPKTAALVHAIRSRKKKRLLRYTIAYLRNRVQTNAPAREIAIHKPAPIPARQAVRVGLPQACDNDAGRALRLPTVNELHRELRVSARRG
jgi:hypothetical protein